MLACGAAAVLPDKSTGERALNLHCEGARLLPRLKHDLQVCQRGVPVRALPPPAHLSVPVYVCMCSVCVPFLESAGLAGG